MWSPDGRRAYQTEAAFPDGAPGNASAAMADADGTVALAISDGGWGGRGFAGRGGILLLDRAGKQLRFIDTGRFISGALCFAEDHSIWIGGDLLGARNNETAPDFGLIRHYSREGSLLGEFLPRSSFTLGYALGISWLRAARDRIGAMTYPGKRTDTPTWVELDLSGREIGRWPLRHEDVTRFMHAFTADGRLFASRWDKNARDAVLEFDRPTSSWKEAGSVTNALLMGADANELVFWDRGTNDPRGDRPFWIAAPAGHP